MNNDPFKDFDKHFNNTMKAAKTILIVTVIGGLVSLGLVSWVVIHFLAKVW
jgi:hypothetical protein